MRNPPPNSETGFAISAEDVGFEPTKVSLAGFQDRCTRPLCESSAGKITRNRLLGKIVQGFTLKNYSGSASNSSMMIATPSSSHAPATPVAYFRASG